MREKKLWEKTEVSTRNCYNALVVQEWLQGSLIFCRRGWDVFDGQQRRVNLGRVSARGVLFSSCRECPSFDNEWD